MAQKVTLFNHLIGASEQRRWHHKPKSFGGFEVYSELEFSGLQNWQIAGLRAFLDAGSKNASLPVHLEDIASVT